MADILLYRGTTETWEKCVIEAKLPPQGISLMTGQFLQRAAQLDARIEGRIINKIRAIHCSQLRSGKEIVMGQHPIPLSNLTAAQINQEIIRRVGFESARGTPNFQSHFIPCGTSKEISKKFGHGGYYRFHVQGKIYGSKLSDIQEYVRERSQLPNYIVPLFQGGSNEVLAYTGSLITSVELMLGDVVSYQVTNSLD